MQRIAVSSGWFYRLAKMLSSPRFYRLILGACVLALLWGAFVWTASGHWEASILAALWSLIFAPLILPPIFWALARTKGHLNHDFLREDSPLRDLVLRCVLHRAVLDMEIWVLEDEEDLGFFWYESFSIVRRRSKTRLVLTRAWLKQLQQSPEAVSKDFEILWDKIASLSRFDRQLRAFQIRSWMGAVFNLEVLLRIMDLLMSFLGVKHLPRSVFWCQGWAWQIKTQWFGERALENLGMKISQHTLRVEGEPRYWNSLLFGVWSYYPSRVLHPTWRLLTREDSLLYS